MLGVVLLAAYACLTTFSRGVYLALPLALAPMPLLADAQRRRSHAVDPESTQAGAGTVVLLLRAWPSSVRWRWLPRSRWRRCWSSRAAVTGA